jgi:hypothetical protein
MNRQVLYPLIALAAVQLFAQLTDNGINHSDLPPPHQIPAPADHMTMTGEDFRTAMRLVYVCGDTDGVITALAKANEADKMATVLELRSHVDCQSVYDITGYKPAPGTKEHAPATPPYQH